MSDTLGQFEWDYKKNRANYAKHGIPFEEAVQVFDDPDCFIRFDRQTANETRQHAIGLIGNAMVILVVHTYRYRDQTPLTRIISARKASRHERREYEEAKIQP